MPIDLSNYQYLRKYSLTATSNSEIVDLSNLQITFKIKQGDVQTPNYAIIRVYNPSDDTARKIQKEFSQVVLQAGYISAQYGQCFVGTIKQVKRGRESAVDTYIDILAADGDEPYNFGVVNVSMAAGSTATDQVNAIAQAMGIQVGYVSPLSTTKLPRGKVLHGMGRDILRRIAASNKCAFSIQNGKLQMLALGSYLPAPAVPINVLTGMIGMPTQTEDGIHVSCLLNPNLGVGNLIQINNKDVQLALQAPGYNALVAFSQLPSLSDDGVYRIYVNEYDGNSRGEEWDQNMTCLSPTGPIPAALIPKIQGQ